MADKMHAPKPSVGRIVHYVSMGSEPDEDGYQKYPSVCNAALVVEVGAWITDEIEVIRSEKPMMRLVQQSYYEDACILDVSSSSGRFHNTCKHDEETKERGTWHWPERV